MTIPCKGMFNSHYRRHDLTLQDAEEIATPLTSNLDAHANVIWGARVRNDMEGKIRVLAIMTGLRKSKISHNGHKAP